MPDIYLHLDGEQKGPFQPDQVRQLIADGKANYQAPAWYQGLPEWSTVHLVLAAFPAVGGPPAFRAPVPPPAPAPLKQGMPGWAIAVIIAGAMFFVAIPCIAILAGVALGPITQGIKKAKESASLQTSRQIELLMFTYAQDHKGAYPTGATSTEVFQKLIDEKYATDPAIFFLDMPGKTKPTSNHLTADNVGYDVTAGITPDSTGTLPVVFASGYDITYSPGAAAKPEPGEQSAFPGMAVAYKDNSAHFYNALPDGTVPGVIPLSFDPGGKSYQQLKP